MCITKEPIYRCDYIKPISSASFNSLKHYYEIQECTDYERPQKTKKETQDITLHDKKEPQSLPRI